MPAVEVRAAAGEIAARRLDALTPERDDPFLVALAEAADDAVLQVDAAAVEADGLADAQAGSVKELDERAVAEGARRRSVRRLDETLDLARRERAGKAGAPPRKVELGGRVVLAVAEEDEMIVEGSRSCRAAGNRG